MDYALDHDQAIIAGYVKDDVGAMHSGAHSFPKFPP